MNDTKRYTDEYISFNIPDGFPERVEMKNRSWSIEQGNRLFSLGIGKWLHESFAAQHENFLTRAKHVEMHELSDSLIPGCVKAGYALEKYTSSRKDKYQIRFSFVFSNYFIMVEIYETSRPNEPISHERYLPIFEGFEFHEEKYNEYVAEQDRIHDEKIVKMGQKRRQALAEKYGLTEDAFFQDLPRLEEKYGVECVRDGYLPGEKPQAKRKSKLSKRAEEILRELDGCSQGSYQFRPDLEHGYFYTAGSRFTLFGDETRWALVFEKSGYHNRQMEICIELNSFGNCLENLSYEGRDHDLPCNSNIVTLVGDEEIERISDEDEIVFPDADQVVVRGELILVPLNPSLYRKNGIELDDPENIHIVELTRLLDHWHGDLFRATEKELRTHIPDDLPKIMTIDQWHHESEYEANLMSEQETYRLMAEVLATLDPKKWKPSQKPNNDWRNWPEAGGL